MYSATLRLPLAATACSLSTCSSPQISTRAINKSDAHSVALVAGVRYTGLWASIGPRLQPVLSDTAFRRSSEERLLIGPRIIAQEHSGSAGKTLVVRERGHLHGGRVHHPPYRISRAIVNEFSIEPARPAGFELAGPPISTLCASSVDVSIFALS